MEKKILIVDSDKTFINEVKHTLEKDNFIVDSLDSTVLIKKDAINDEYDALIVELDMPDMDGIEVCRRVREISEIPLIIVSENRDEVRRILALEYGADDFILKPMNVLELKARINTILRRVEEVPKQIQHTVIRGDFVINTLRKRVTTKVGDDLNLTGKEFDLFYVLSSHPGRVFTRDELMEKVWGYENFGMSRTVDVHIRKLRSKIEKRMNKDYIMTKWGVGYYFQP